MRGWLGTGLKRSDHQFKITIPKQLIFINQWHGRAQNLHKYHYIVFILRILLSDEILKSYYHTLEGF